MTRTMAQCRVYTAWVITLKAAWTGEGSENWYVGSPHVEAVTSWFRRGSALCGEGLSHNKGQRQNDGDA